MSNSTFYVGDTIYYNFTYIPQDTSFKGINIDCDSSFATIGADNSITFIKESQSLELTFTASKNSNLIKKFSIAVDPVLATSIEITNKPSSDETFYVGQSYTLKLILSLVMSLTRQLALVLAMILSVVLTLMEESNLRNPEQLKFMLK